LFFAKSKYSEWADVTIASLDEPEKFPPEKSIWTEDKLPWILLNPEQPSFEQDSPESG
jgi:hypothetical protein